MSAVPICATNVTWSRRIRGSKGDLYVVSFGEKDDGTFGWACTCPDFRLRRQARQEVCKHVRVASTWRCCWNAEREPRPTPADGMCPRCHAPILLEPAAASIHGSG